MVTLRLRPIWLARILIYSGLRKLGIAAVDAWRMSNTPRN